MDADDDLEAEGRAILLAGRIVRELRKPAPVPVPQPCTRQSLTCTGLTTRMLYARAVCEGCEPVRRVVPDDTFLGARSGGG